MSGSDAQLRYDETLNQLMCAWRCATELSEPAEIEREESLSPTLTKTPASAPPASPTPCNPANKLWTKRTQREAFMQHLRDWASNHDSSVYFRGSIILHPQGTFPDEVVELGKSVNCILVHASSEKPPKKIVIRLFQSQRYDSNAHQQKVQGWKGIHGQPMAPYQLVIRCGSGWIPARQYLDKHYFARRARLEKGKEANYQSTPTQSPAPVWPSLIPNNFNFNNINGIAEVNTPPKQSDQHDSGTTRSKHAGSSSSARDTVKISPLFRPFLRLPQELQDEVLYQAIGYTRIISLTRTVNVRHAPSLSETPITLSKLFRISKLINEHMAPHIFSSTNFHFGMTGFTKFLWQLGPINRSNLRHLTFHYGKASLLHCIRWLAPDPVWELFEPPVATNPPTLTYFWRCQLQDLVRELNLSTITIDIRGVPLADIPMLVKIVKTAMSSVERIRIIDNHDRSGILAGESAQDLHTRFKDMPYPTWRELSLQYYNNYKHQRWHVKRVLALHDVDLRPVLDTWTIKDKAFFDS